MVLWVLIVVLVAVLSIAAGTIILERRLLALWQDRYGPNRAGPFGIFQIVADMLKIFFKENWTPPFADKIAFVIAPAIIVLTILLSFAVVPFSPLFTVSHLNVGLLFFLGMTSLGVYSIILGGWSANSKYALLGSIRSIVQMLSYEVFMGLSVVGVVMLAGSFDVGKIVEAQRGIWFFIPQIVGFVNFFIGGLAVTHRIPFDLPEAENELVAGYHTEYSGLSFGMFYVGEYLGIFLISSMTVTLFFGGWLGPWLPPLLWFLIKTFVFVVLFILIRGSLGRPRYDQLLAFGWKLILPLALANIVVTAIIYNLVKG